MFDNLVLTFYDFCLFAQRAAPKKSGRSLDMNSVIMIILGAAIITAIAVVAYYIGSHLRRGAFEKEKPPTTSDDLAAFRDATDEGSMTTREFDRVKRHLSRKILHEVKDRDASPDEPEDNTPKFFPK